MRVAIGADHAGFLLKEHLKQTLQRLGHAVEDLGTDSEASVDYPPICMAVGRAVAAGAPTVASCSAGAARVSRLRPTRWPACARRSATTCLRPACHASTTMRTCSQWAAEIVAFGLADEILELWLNTDFVGGRHQRRIDQIAEGNYRRAGAS